MLTTLKRLIKNYFGFSGHQINGFLVLLPLMVILIFSVPAYRYWLSLSTLDFSADAAFLDSLVFVSFTEKKDSISTDQPLHFSMFNPNEIGEEEFSTMGLPKYLAKRIINYRQKGGQFRIKSDLAKIYGLPPALYLQMEPYIDLPDTLMVTPKTKEKFTKKEYTKKVIVPFDLNAADTAQLKQISGIGNVLSERIVKYRGQLGGFISPQQLGEVYHLDSVTIVRLLEHAFIEENFQPVKLNINLATEYQLGKHPYISYKSAKAIVAYRFQHGKFTSLETLEKIVPLSVEDRERMKPYLTVE